MRPHADVALTRRRSVGSRDAGTTRVDCTGLRSRARRVRPELRRGTRGRGRVQRVPPRSEGGRPLGWHRRRGDRPVLGGRRDHPRVLHHEGPDGGLREQARPGGPTRRRRAGRAVLARVRRQRQGVGARLVSALAPDRAVRRRREAHGRRSAGVGPGGRGARRASAVLGAGLAARLPRDHLRLARRRGRAASLGSQHRDVLAAGDRRPARSRRVDRPSRRQGTACGRARGWTRARRRHARRRARGS